MMKHDKPVDPGNVGFFSTVAELPGTDYLPDLVQKLRSFHPLIATQFRVSANICGKLPHICHEIDLEAYSS